MVKDLSVEIPELVLASVTDDGEKAYILKRDQIHFFLEEHRDKEYVLHNSVFDFWVIEKWLAGSYKRESLYLDTWEAVHRFWWNLFSSGKVHDTLLLDRLVRIARGDGEAGGGGVESRNLKRVSNEYAPFISGEVDKDSPYRENFQDLLGACWSFTDPGFFNYAAIDCLATWHCYKGLVEEGKRLLGRVLDFGYFDSGVVEKYGLLTEQIQIKAAIALAHVTRTGICINKEKALVMEEKLRGDVKVHWDFLFEHYGDKIFKWKKDGTYETTKSGKMPSLSKKNIHIILKQIAEERGFELPRSTGKTKAISGKEDDWKPFLKEHPFLEHWMGPQSKKKLLEFYSYFHKSAKLHPKYDVIKTTGRVSSFNPNIQQMPRDKDFRSIFIASPGYKLLTIDYSFIELRTLAATCEKRFGFSVLGEVIRGGRDPHAFTAASFMGRDTSPEALKAWKVSDPDEFKRMRQAAKAVNFGVPGGLGANKLSSYAKDNYGVSMSMEEARAFREKLIYETYPELSDMGGYLSSTTSHDLAFNLGISIEQVKQVVAHFFPKRNPDRMLYIMNRVLRKLPFLRSGEEFDKGTQKRCEECLKTLFVQSGKNEYWERYEALGMEEDKEKRIKRGSALMLTVFGGVALTLTGRLRGRTDFCNRTNCSFQGLAADGMKLSLFELLKRGCRVVAQIHDEVIVELLEDEAEEESKEVYKIMKEQMEGVLGGVPVELEMSLGYSWSK